MTEAPHLGDEVEPYGCRVVTAAGLEEDAPATKVMRGGPALEGGGRAASEPDDELAVGKDADSVEDRDGATGFETKDEDSSEERLEARLFDPPHGEEPMERQVSPSSSEPVPDAAAVEHRGALEGAPALPAKPPKWEIASKWLEFDESSALGPPPPPAPMALGRRIATPFSCSTVEPSRAASSSKAHAEPVDATEARTERDELSVLRAELAEAQAQIRESASARGGGGGLA